MINTEILKHCFEQAAKIEKHILQNIPLEVYNKALKEYQFYFMNKLMNKWFNSNYQTFKDSGIYQSEDDHYLNEKWLKFRNNPVDLFGELDSEHQQNFIEWIISD